MLGQMILAACGTHTISDSTDGVCQVLVTELELFLILLKISKQKFYYIM